MRVQGKHVRFVPYTGYTDTVAPSIRRMQKIRESKFRQQNFLLQHSCLEIPGVAELDSPVTFQGSQVTLRHAILKVTTRDNSAVCLFNSVDVIIGQVMVVNLRIPQFQQVLWRML